MQQRRGTASQWTSADPILGAGEIGFETDSGQFKIGDGVNHWSDISYFKNLEDLGGTLDDYIPLTQRGANSGVATLDSSGKIPVDQLGNLVDGAPDALNTLNELAAAINDDSTFAATIVSSLGTKLNLTGGNMTGSIDMGGNRVNNLASPNGDTEAARKKYVDDAISGLSSTVTTGLGTKQDKITGVSDAEIGYLDGVTSAIQTQINSKLATSTASSTYAPLAGPTFTGIVVLPSTTSIGNVSSTELGYVDGVTSAIQTQIDSKAPTDSPTFTGTVAGVTKTHVGLANVDNTADSAKPVSTATQTALDLKANLAAPTFTGTVVLPSTTSIGNVSSTEIGYVDGVTSAIQTQLDAKLPLAGGTLTGALTLSGAPTSDLHAATKLYVDGIAAGINFHQPVVAATTGNLAGTYNNGTNGLGATLTKASNGSIGTIDGATVVVGDRILLRSQTATTENGIYTVTAVGSVSAPWQVTRATDADNNPTGELTTGDFCFVTSGSTNAAKGFILSTTGTITVGTTGITYSQFNASEAVTAGTGITKSGSTISISTGAITSDMISDGTIVDADINASAAIAQSKISGLSTSLGLKANLAAPSFTGGVTVDSSGIIFTDATQVKAGVPSITTINQQAGAYTTVIADRDKLVEVSSASGVTVTIPTNANVAYPVGTSIDILQTGAGQVTIAGASGVTVNATPGLKLRTQWSSATLFKRATDTWVVFGDLTA